MPGAECAEGRRNTKGGKYTLYVGLAGAQPLPASLHRPATGRLVLRKDAGRAAPCISGRQRHAGALVASGNAVLGDAAPPASAAPRGAGLAVRDRGPLTAAGAEVPHVPPLVAQNHGAAGTGREGGLRGLGVLELEEAIEAVALSVADDAAATDRAHLAQRGVKRRADGPVRSAPRKICQHQRHPAGRLLRVGTRPLLAHNVGANRCGWPGRCRSPRSGGGGSGGDEVLETGGRRGDRRAHSGRAPPEIGIARNHRWREQAVAQLWRPLHQVHQSLRRSRVQQHTRHEVAYDRLRAHCSKTFCCARR